jgi:hypothetical protein
LVSIQASPYRKIAAVLSEVARTSPRRGLITNASPSRGNGVEPTTPKSTQTQPLNPSGSRKMSFFGLLVEDCVDWAAANDVAANHTSKLAENPRCSSVQSMEPPFAFFYIQEL